jgi:L-ascorbate metabolism protein UlaG (beta-lactamase superfamily)
MPSRRWIFTGVSAAAIGALGTAAYRRSPLFWQQWARELGRDIARPQHRPMPAAWSTPGLHAAWLGHSTVLLRIDGYTILTDPVFSDRAGIHFGPLALGVKRMVAPALALEELPPIDLVLLSHAHMDHMDLPSLRALESMKTQVILAWQTSDLIRTDRYAKVTELGWGMSARSGPATVRAIEVNHWGARLQTDTYRGYNGYVIEAGRHRVLFAGDTANTDKFRGVHTMRGLDLAIMPIGAYNPWIRAHCTPEQAWRMGNEANVDRFLPVHHKTFALGREPVGEPIDRFLTAAGNAVERVLARSVGEEIHLG